MKEHPFAFIVRNEDLAIVPGTNEAVSRFGSKNRLRKALDHQIAFTVVENTVNAFRPTDRQVIITNVITPAGTEKIPLAGS